MSFEDFLQRLTKASETGQSYDLDPVEVCDVVEQIERFNGEIKNLHKMIGQIDRQHEAEIRRLREGLEAVRIWNDDGNGRIVHSDLADHITAVLSEEG